MKKIMFILPSIIFNFAETLVIILAGFLLKLKLEIIILILTTFAMIRISLGGAMHYKSPYKCAIWSLLVFLSLFVLTNVGWLVSIIMAIFCAFILTTKGDINDAFMWKRNELNERVLEWTRFNLDNELLIKYKNNLKETDKRKYYIYVYYFEEHKSFETISQIMDIDRQRIGEEVAIMSHFIEYGIRLR